MKLLKLLIKLLKLAGAHFPVKNITAIAISTLVLVICTSTLIVEVGDISAKAETSAGGEQQLTILHTNDEHSAVIPHSPLLDFNSEDDSSVGGMNRLAASVEAIVQDHREENTPVFLFNAGDFMAGTPFSWLAMEGYGPELKLLRQIGYDAAVLGNHEFDYGVEILRDYMEDAGYPAANEELAVLGSNIISPEGYFFQEYYRDYEIIEKEGVKIGIMGLIGEDAARAAPETGQLEFVRPSEAAQQVLDVLEGYGVDITIALTHAGLEEDKALAREVEGLDIIVGGHSHDILTRPKIVNDTYIVQAGDSLEYLGKMELVFQPEEGKINLSDYELIRLDSKATDRVNFAEENTDDYSEKKFNISEIQYTIDDYRQKLNRLLADITGGRFNSVSQPVIMSDFDLKKEPYVGENPAGNFITDAMRIEASRVLEEEVDIAFQGNGQIRGGFYAGGAENLMTFYDLAAPNSLGTGPADNFGFPLVSGYITGEEVKTLLEVAAFVYQVESDRHFIHFSGLSYSYDPDNALLGTIPGLDIPLLPMRAVTEAKFYPGTTPQPDSAEDEQFSQLEDDKLYKLVTDSHMLSQISLVEDIIPWVDLQPKDAEGNPLDIDNMQEHVVVGEEGELKVWQAVVNYADDLNPAGLEQPDQAEIARMPQYYAGTQGRIEKVDTVSHRLIFILGLLLTATVLGGIIWRLFRKMSG